MTATSRHFVGKLQLRTLPTFILALGLLRVKGTAAGRVLSFLLSQGFKHWTSQVIGGLSVHCFSSTFKIKHTACSTLRVHSPILGKVLCQNPPDEVSLASFVLISCVVEVFTSRTNGRTPSTDEDGKMQLKHWVHLELIIWSKCSIFLRWLCGDSRGTKHTDNTSSPADQSQSSEK